MANTRQKQIVFFISIVSCLFFLAIAFDITPLLRGPAPYPPDWRWDYLFINTLSKIWAPLLVIVCTSIWFLQSENFIKKKKEYVLLLGVIFLSFLFQIAIIYFSRAGVFVLIHRIINPDLNGYFTAATMIDNVSVFLQNYNNTVLHLPQHAQGHPPGAIFFFWYINKFFALFSQSFSFLDSIQPNRADVNLVWKMLSSSEKAGALFSAFFIPFLSSCTVVPFYFLVKRLYTTTLAIQTTFLYIFLPSIVLFIPINDVFLPFFTVLTVFFFVKAQQQKNVLLFLLSGIILSVGVFLSLSLLPIGFFLGIYTLLMIMQKKITFIFSLQSGMYFLLGFLLLPFFLFFFFQFNFLEVSKTLMSGLPESRLYTTWIWYNLSDFFIFGGVPVCILFILGIQKLFQQFVKKKYTEIDPILVAFIVMLCVINFSGSVRGEVARIWLPFYPLLLLPLVQFLKPKKIIFLTILLLQAIQIIVMQEFWVTLW